MSISIKQSYEIKNLTELLEKCLKRKVLNYWLKLLTKPGENFGSLMQSLNVIVAGKDDFNKVILSF